jgi:ketosteroid isomerase-like protein
MSNTKTIQNLYEAFGRGDVVTILSYLTDDVDWNNSGVASKECPWNGDFSGKGQVPAFFKTVDDNLEFGVFNPHTFVDSGDHVAVVLRIESHLKKNGHALKNDCVHIWTFDQAGKVSKYRHFNDTAAELAAWRAPDRASGKRR